MVVPVTARAPKRPRAPLTCRFMCIRCGQVVSSTPDKLAEAMEPHFTDKLKFGCPHVESRRPNVSIAFFDHGLDDVLFHTQRELDRARRDAADKRNTAIALKRDADGLRGQLEAAKVEVAQLKAAAATVAARPASVVGQTLGAIAESSTARARKLRAALHPDGLEGEELRAGAKRVWDEAGL